MDYRLISTYMMRQAGVQLRHSRNLLSPIIQRWCRFPISPPAHGRQINPLTTCFKKEQIQAYCNDLSPFLKWFYSQINKYRIALHRSIFCGAFIWPCLHWNGGFVIFYIRRRSFLKYSFSRQVQIIFLKFNPYRRCRLSFRIV